MLNLCLKCRSADERKDLRVRPGNYDCPRCGRNWTALQAGQIKEWLAATNRGDRDV